MPCLVAFAEPCLVEFTGILIVIDFVVGICLFVDRFFKIASLSLLNDDFFSTIEVGIFFFSSLIKSFY